MTTSYSQPWHSRPAPRKAFVAGAAILVVLAATAVALPFTPLWGSFTEAEQAVVDAPVQNAAAPAATTTAPAASVATFSLGVVSAAPAAPVEAAIRVTGAQNLGGASLRLTYDPAVVQVTSVRNGDVAGSTLTWHEGTTGTLTMLLTTSRADGWTGAGSFAVVTFEATEGAMGTSTPLTLSLVSVTNAEREAIAAQTVSGSFRNGVRGDVDGNGIVERADYDLLSRHLVGDDVEILELNADLDGDGKITDVDALILHQQLDAPRNE